MILLGAAGGDIAGSRFEFDNHRSKDFELFAKECFITDDTVMTMAVAAAIMCTKAEMDGGYTGSEAELLLTRTTQFMQNFGREFPGLGYGGNFAVWLRAEDPKPYGSFGNGSAMRVSACGWAGRDEDEVRNLATWVSEPTHNHPEGVKGAVATALAIYYARTGMSKEDIRSRMARMYDLNFTLDGIRDTYRFNEICQQTVPQALVAFLESESYEDTLRGAISIGGDSDTLAAIAGSIAEAYYGIPQPLQDKILSYFYDDDAELLVNTLTRFNIMFGEG